MNRSTLNLLIVEDHSLQAELLQEQLLRMGEIKVVGIATNTVEYMKAMTINEHINGVMLDEDLSDSMSGTTAYMHLQLRGRNVPTVLITGNAPPAHLIADLNIADVIDKPYTTERLAIAIKKLRSMNNYNQFIEAGGNLVPVISDKINHLLPADILFIESINRTIYIHTQDGQMLESKIPLKLYEDYLQSNRFVPIHRSCLVNLTKVSNVDKHNVYFTNSEVQAVLSEERTVDFMRLYQAYKQFGH